MPGHDIIVVGASAGGVEALTNLVQQLPSDLNASIFIVLHVPSQGRSVLPKILNRAKRLKAHHPKDGEAIVKGKIYVAPPGFHLLVEQGHVHLTLGPRENSHRPAIDPLFRTAARAYGPRVVGVVLTGNLDDGTPGLIAVKMQGGIAVVQDPSDATYKGMPTSAIQNVKNIDYILPLSDIPNVLVNLANNKVEVIEENSVREVMEIESDMSEMDSRALNQDDRPGKPSEFACPECGGVLWELHDGDLLRFRCRTGHAFSPAVLVAEQSHAVEDALWSALRALKEKSSLTRRIAERMRDRHHDLAAKQFEHDARDADRQAEVIRQVLLSKQANATIDEDTKQE